MDDRSGLLNYRFFNALPVILQSEVAECGLACVAMIANYHGHHVDLNALRHRFAFSSRGTTLEELISIGNKLDFISRPLRLEVEELVQLACPCVLHWDFNHFVVLKKVTKQHLVIHDPAVGLRKISIEDASKHFTGVALEFSKAATFQKKDIAKKVRLRDFWTHIDGLKTILIQLFLLSVVLQLFSIITPFYMQLVVDDVVVGHDFSLLLVLALGFGLLMLLSITVRLVRKLIILYMTTQLDMQVNANVFRHLLYLPLDFFEKRHLGDILSRFDSLDSVKEIMTTRLIQAVVDGLLSISLLIVMFIYSPKLTMVIIAVLFIYVSVRLLFYRPYRNLNEEAINAKAVEESNFMESIRAIQSIKLFGYELKRLQVWQGYYARAVNIGIKVFKLEISYQFINDLLFGLENIVVIYLAALLIIDNQMSIGMLFAFIAYKNQFTGSVSALVDMFIQFKMLSLHLERLADLLLTNKESNLESQANMTEISGNLSLHGIQFRYSDGEPIILEDINLQIDKNQTIAITGASGSGKTTLMKIMLGLLKPTLGEVRVDGKNISKLGLSNYRKCIGTVMQDDQLLSGSIRENISFFGSDVQEAEIISVATIAGIHEDIILMPMGYDTLVGDMGSTLSGGQKQRLLLARALFKQPKILFLDEATSHLDQKMERIVNDKIKRLGITVILIAHRQETIKMAEKVYQLDDGQLNLV